MPANTDCERPSIPPIEDLELDWYEDPERADQVVRLFNDMVLNGDIANNLAATGLVTNAFLYTGDGEVPEVGAGTTSRHGLIELRPTAESSRITSVPTGKPGEQRGRPVVGRSLRLERARVQQPRSLDHDRRAVRPASLRRLRIPRPAEVTDQKSSSIRPGHAKDGQLVVPTKHGPDGWSDYGPIRLKELAHLYHMSMSNEGQGNCCSVPTQVRWKRDWTNAKPHSEKNDGTYEGGRFLYYEGT